MARQPTTRSGRMARRVLTALVVLGVLVAADRISVLAAERAAADTLQSSEHLGSRPSVGIAGFPFLNQLALGSFDKITVGARDVPVGNSSHTLNVSRVDVTLHHLDVSRDFSKFAADTASATALLTYPDLSDTLGVTVRYAGRAAGGGRIEASKSITFAGRTLSATLSAQPHIVNGFLGFGAVTVNGLTGVAASVVAGLISIFDLRISLDRIPFGIRVRSLVVSEQGVRLTLTGHDLFYTRASR